MSLVVQETEEDLLAELRAKVREAPNNPPNRIALGDALLRAARDEYAEEDLLDGACVSDSKSTSTSRARGEPLIS